jgi:molecular chaperone Hsp33
MEPKLVMNNHVTTFLFDQLDIRGRYVRLTSEWQQWQTNRHTTPVATQLLGECVAFLTLVAIDVKSLGKLTLQLRGQGQVKTLVVQCQIDREELKLRGMIEAPELIQLDSLSQAFADGDLALTLYNELTQTNYQSIVPIEGDSATRVFSDYLSQSVQHPTSLWLMADEQQVTGLLLEKMPDTDAKDPDGWQRINHLASTLTDAELRDCSLDTLLHRLFHEEVIQCYQPTPVIYHCPDERDKLIEVIRSLGQDECERIISEEGKLIMSNELCNRSYVFSLADVQGIFGIPTKH